MAWTISYQGDERALEDWGLCDLVRERLAVGAHTCKLLRRPARGATGADAELVDALDLFDYGKTVIVYRDRVRAGSDWTGGARWFYGRVDPWDRQGRAGEEAHIGMLVNPWWYLRELPFEQWYKAFDHWTTPDDPTTPPVFRLQRNAHVYLNMAFDTDLHPDLLQTVGEQISEIVQFAIDKGAPIALGSVGLNFRAPIDEIRANITCEEALQKQWRWAPDTVFLWDYATEPYPTFSCVQAPDLAAWNIDLASGTLLTNVRVKPRPDWKRPFVRIYYEQENNGFLNLFEDVWPNPAPTEPEKQFGGLTTTINLIGQQSNKQSTFLETKLIQETQVNWWKDRIGWMTDPSVGNGNFTLSEFKREGLNGVPYDTALTNEWVDGGTMPAWLEGNGVRGQRIRVSAKTAFTDKVGTKQVRILDLEFTATNGSGPYTNTEVTEVGEARPVGLAQKVWESLQSLGVEGSFSTKEKELGSALDTWKVLNFTTDRQPEWATIRGLPQSITESALAGTMEVQFGAPLELSAGQLVDLLRVARFRLVFNWPGTRVGKASQRAVDLGKKAAQKGGSDGAGFVLKQVLSENATATGYKITHDGQVAQSDWIQPGPSGGKVSIEVIRAQGKTLYIREYPICIDNVQKHVLLLGTDPY